MEQLQGKVVAITGAASGIGRELAKLLARKGSDLALSDVNEEGLAETVKMADRPGITITAQVLDVADRDAMEAWAKQVVADHGRVNVIVNNAGVAVGATVESMSYEDFDWLTDINYLGVVNGTKAFLPLLKESGEGHVVNISSVFGLIGIPTQSAYNGAKFAVRGFTEALRLELDVERCGVSASCVHPGGIKTNIARNARLDVSVTDLAGERDVAMGFDQVARTSPEKAAAVIVRGIERDQRRVLIGPDAYLFALLGKLPPSWYQGLIAAGARLRAQRG